MRCGFGWRARCMLACFSVLTVCVAGVAALPAASAAEADVDDPTLRVAIRELPPFVERVDDRWSGFSIDVWELVADRMDVETEYVVVASVDEQLDAVRQGRADAAITAISITSEREETVDFSIPVYSAGLQIMVHREDRRAQWAALEALTESNVLRLLGLLLVAVTIFGTLVWFVERRKNDHFQGRHGGFWEGIWFAFVTLATVGYGDRVTRTALGRIISVVWMLVALVFVAQLTATIASNLTVSTLRQGIDGVDDLSDREVITIAGTTADEYLQREGIEAERVTQLDQLVEAVEDQEVDAAVYDAPVLQYEVKRHGNLDLAGAPFTDEYYGAAFPLGSPWRKEFNEAFLELTEDGSATRLRDAWFSR